MTQQVINLGTVPNDATGDPLQTAGTKINANFTELYGKGYYPFAPVISILGSDFSVANNTTLANAGPSVALVAGVWLITSSWWMYTNGGTNGGWRFGYTYSGTFVNSESFIGGMVTTAGAYNGSFINLAGGNLTSLSNANPDLAHYFGIVDVATAGTVNMQFAQNSSNATASILRAGSGIIAQRLV